jgi:DNA ligase-1
LYAHKLGFNKTASILGSDDKPIPDSIKYIIYDGMPLGDWNKQECKIVYHQRLLACGTKLTLVKFDLGNNIDLCPTWTVKSINEVKDHYKQCLNSGYEGIMLKNPEGLYQWKRVRLSSQTMMKVKPHVSEDLEVIGIEEGEGKYKKSLGKLIVAYKGVKIGVGSGYTDAERSSIWGQSKAVIGRFIEVQGMEFTQDNSIRHPVFIRFRDDK